MSNILDNIGIEYRLYLKDNLETNICRNGTEGNHAEDREMECCHRVLVGGDQFGGIHATHPYIAGEFKKIGVCDGRSLYQNINNTEIFMYYVCGRWFIGLEVRTNFIIEILE